MALEKYQEVGVGPGVLILSGLQPLPHAAGGLGAALQPPLRWAGTWFPEWLCPGLAPGGGGGDLLAVGGGGPRAWRDPMCAQACENGRGAILLSVARGKVSEGIDFGESLRGMEHLGNRIGGTLSDEPMFSAGLGGGAPCCNWQRPSAQSLASGPAHALGAAPVSRSAGSGGTATPTSLPV